MNENEAPLLPPPIVVNVSRFGFPSRSRVHSSL